MKLFRIILLVIFVASANYVCATPLVQLSLSELSFTTESGYIVNVKRNFDGRITKLKISKNGRAIAVPSAAYKDIADAAIHEIVLYEDMSTQYFELRIPAFTDNKEGGSHKARELHSLVFRDLVYNAQESKIEFVPAN
jgi:hypothetical protein